MKNKKEIGELLKKTRLTKELDIAKIADEIRVRRQYLTCIENGDFDEIPGKAYISGYIKLYAKYLGIHSDIKKLQEEPILERKSFEKAKEHINDNWVVASIIAIFVLVTIILVVFRGTSKKETTIMDRLVQETVTVD